MESAGIRSDSLASRAARFALAGAAFLVALYALFFLSWSLHRSLPAEVRDLFDVKSEQGLLTWWTLITNALVGVACLLLAARERASGRKAFGWIGTGAFFLYLSLDDATGLHERVNWIATPRLGMEGLYVWVLVLGPLFALAGVAIFVHLWNRFDGADRLRCALAFGLLGTALGLEAVEKSLVESGLRWRGFPLYAYSVAIEELFEAVAPALLLGCIGVLLERELTLAERGEVLVLDELRDGHGPRRTG